MAKAKAAKEPEARDLPGMPIDERRIPEIEVAAGNLDGINKEFAEVSKRKKAAKKELRDVMKRHKKEHYYCGGVEAWCEPQDDSVKVKLFADADTGPGDSDDSDPE